VVHGIVGRHPGDPVRDGLIEGHPHLPGWQGVGDAEGETAVPRPGEGEVRGVGAPSDCAPLGGGEEVGAEDDPHLEVFLKPAADRLAVGESWSLGAATTRSES
jgi:hypothetical protein